MCYDPPKEKAVFPVGPHDQEQSKKNPKPEKMVAHRQVQPTEPDKGTNNTQM